jgi:hypothetical protein
MEVWLTRAGPPWCGTKAKQVRSIRTEPTFESPLPSGLGTPFVPLGSVASIAAKASAGGCHVNLAPVEPESKGSDLVQAAVAARQF